VRLLHTWFVMTVRALLNENPNPSVDEVREALAANLCAADATLASPWRCCMPPRRSRRSEARHERNLQAARQAAFCERLPAAHRWAGKAQGRAPYADDVISERNYPGCCTRACCAVRTAGTDQKSGREQSCRAAGCGGGADVPGPEAKRMKPTNAGWTDAVDTVSYEK